MSTQAIESLPDYPNPLVDSYTYHSKCPTTPGKYIMGVDEAGRGPVLGPLVYGVAFCPVEYKEKLDDMGFNDSKQLNAQTRSTLLESLSSDPENLGWAVRVISPQDLSRQMLNRPPTNLNVQSQSATFHLISSVLHTLNIEIAELYVDALGPPAAYQRLLKEKFPQIPEIRVETKADAKYRIVGAASVAAKVTRDAWIEGWVWHERPNASTAQVPPNGEDNADNVMEVDSKLPWPEELGSGYPSDPKTQAWLQAAIDPTFGYPSIARFSWATVKVQLDKNGHKVEWTDEQQTAAKAFHSVKPADKDRCLMAKELGLHNISSL